MTPTQLSRTFSYVRKSADDSEDWIEYSGLKIIWKNLIDNRLAVVIGEAVIGKTVEFQLEAQRLRSSGKPAYFVALNQLVDIESWVLALGERMITSNVGRHRLRLLIF